MWEKVEAKLIMNALEFELYVTLALFRSTDYPVSTWCVGTRLVARKVQELEEIVRNAARSETTRHIESLSLCAFFKISHTHELEKQCCDYWDP
jgi:hypothetical protein